MRHLVTCATAYAEVAGRAPGAVSRDGRGRPGIRRAIVCAEQCLLPEHEHRQVPTEERNQAASSSPMQSPRGWATSMLRTPSRNPAGPPTRGAPGHCDPIPVRPVAVSTNPARSTSACRTPDTSTTAHRCPNSWPASFEVVAVACSSPVLDRISHRPRTSTTDRVTAEHVPHRPGALAVGPVGHSRRFGTPAQGGAGPQATLDEPSDRTPRSPHASLPAHPAGGPSRSAHVVLFVDRTSDPPGTGSRTAARRQPIVRAPVRSVGRCRQVSQDQPAAADLDPAAVEADPRLERVPAAHGRGEPTRVKLAATITTSAVSLASYGTMAMAPLPRIQHHRIALAVQQLVGHRASGHVDPDQLPAVPPDLGGVSLAARRTAAHGLVRQDRQCAGERRHHQHHCGDQRNGPVPARATCRRSRGVLQVAGLGRGSPGDDLVPAVGRIDPVERAADQGSSGLLLGEQRAQAPVGRHELGPAPWLPRCPAQRRPTVPCVRPRRPVRCSSAVAGPTAGRAQPPGRPPSPPPPPPPPPPLPPPLLPPPRRWCGCGAGCARRRPRCG